MAGDEGATGGGPGIDWHLASILRNYLISLSVKTQFQRI
jgi:hypothetical protein